MGAWDNYDVMHNTFGNNLRDMWVGHTRENVARMFMDSPSCRTVKINGIAQDVVIVRKNKTEMDQKIIMSIPGEHLEHGGIVDFANNKWLITMLDADNQIYDRGIMQQCNHILRWIGKDGQLKQKWCFVADGTKYLIGERSEEIMTVGDARIAVTVGKDEDTVELARGLRFLIDDTDSEACLAYQITKPNKMFNVYNGKGVFRFIMTEVNLEDGDNKVLRIANYADWHPPVKTDGDHVDSNLSIAHITHVAKDAADMPPADEKEGWL